MMTYARTLTLGPFCQAQGMVLCESSSGYLCEHLLELLYFIL